MDKLFCKTSTNKQINSAVEFISNKDIRAEVEITTKYTSWNGE